MNLHIFKGWVNAVQSQQRSEKTTTAPIYEVI